MGAIQLELDEDLVAVLPASGEPVEQAAWELIVLELYRRKTISSGKAAALLGMDRFEFIRFAAGLGIPFLEMSEAEWDAELARFGAL